MALARQICAIGGFVIDSCPLYSHKGNLLYNEDNLVLRYTLRLALQHLLHPRTPRHDPALEMQRVRTEALGKRIDVDRMSRVFRKVEAPEKPGERDEH